MGKNLTDILISNNIVYLCNGSYKLNKLKFREDYLRNNNLELLINYIKLEDLCLNLVKESSKLIRKSKVYQLSSECICCGNPTQFINWNSGFKKYCSQDCRNIIRSNSMKNKSEDEKKESLRKRRETCLKKYNFISPNQSEDIKKKTKDTNIQKYGVEYVSQNKEIRNKQENTKLFRYGDKNYNNIEKQQETMVQKYGKNTTFKIKELRNDKKRKENNQIKFGNVCPLVDKKVYEKAINAKIEKYNNPKFVNSEKHKETLSFFSKEDWELIHNKRLDTIELIYGDRGYINIEKRNITCLDRYGVINFSQASLNMNNGYRWKEYTLPSGKIIKYQGYEDKLLDKLLECYDENDIITSRGEMPEFWYIGLDNKKHRYFPDAYIPKINTIYEVKSEYTLNISLETNELKFKSVIDSGYKFELIIF